MSKQMPRCQIRPEWDDRVSFLVDGRLVAQWNFGQQDKRPCLYPLIGPAGEGLTRMGHPGAPNHDHHDSVWFAHAKALGINFWSNESNAVIRQSGWLAYDETDQESRMAVELEWLDGHDPSPLLRQLLILVVKPLPVQGELFLEFHSTWTPVAEQLEFQQTNFGFLAVRVSASLSEYFGGGLLTDSEGRTTEAEIFGRKARWMDYSGPVRSGSGELLQNGITYMDHPGNPGYPNGWHVREDGWMGMSPCMFGPLMTSRDRPLTLRMGLLVHDGKANADAIDRVHEQFAASAGLECVPAGIRHTYRTVRRIDADPAK